MSKSLTMLHPVEPSVFANRAAPTRSILVRHWRRVALLATPLVGCGVVNWSGICTSAYFFVLVGVPVFGATTAGIFYLYAKRDADLLAVRDHFSIFAEQNEHYGRTTNI
jgi:hypothetical protein